MFNANLLKHFKSFLCPFEQPHDTASSKSTLPAQLQLHPEDINKSTYHLQNNSLLFIF